MQLVERNDFAINRELVEAGALLHDIGVYPLFDDTGKLRDGVHYITHGAEGEDILEAEGMPIAIVRFAAHHTGVGLTKQDVIDQKLPLPVSETIRW